LFRYQLIREAADPALSTRQRGRLVRELAGRAHPGPSGDPVRVSRETIDRWIRAWRAGGFAAPAPPAPAGAPPPRAAGVGPAGAPRAGGGGVGCWGGVGRRPPGGAPAAGARRAGGPPPPPGGAPAAGLRPVRGVPAERAVDRRRAARPPGRRAQGVPVRRPGR